MNSIYRARLHLLEERDGGLVSIRNKLVAQHYRNPLLPPRTTIEEVSRAIKPLSCHGRPQARSLNFLFLKKA